MEQTTETTQNGATKVKVAPIPPDRYQSADAPKTNGAAENTAIPPTAGARIPIPIRSAKANGNPSSSVATQMISAFEASIPDVMAPDDTASDVPMPEPETVFVEATPETVEEQVQRLRPRTIRLQLRFLYTVLFALWLFGRLIFWQIYVARFFPNWVNDRNVRRWRKYAREFRHFAIRMGGVMIKAGQFASTRADILPEEVITELAGLQDRVPTIPFSRIEAVLREELGDYDDFLEWVDEEPIAAASLGQVHRARLKTGEEVVVKVQRPRVRDTVYTDMAALFIVGHVAMRFNFVRRRVDAALIIEEFGRVLLEEISYEKEASNAERFAHMYEDDPGVYVPTLYNDHCTDKVLVMQDVTAIKIDDYARLAAAGIDRKEVAKRLMDTYMNQVFEQRFFHADPHPGNLFVYPLPVEDEAQYIGKGGRPFYLIFIDFGMTGELTREIVQGLINTLTAVITRDAKKLVQSYMDLGFLLPNADVERIEEAVKLVFDQVWGMNMSEMNSMDFEVISDIGDAFSDLLYDLPFRVPQDFVYLGRTVSILSGMATKLDPSFNPWTEIQQNVQQLITTDTENNIFDEFGKMVAEAFDEIATQGPQGLIAVAERFLRQFQRASRTEQMLQRIIDGDVTLNTKLNPLQARRLERLEIQGKRTSRVFIAGSLLISATLLYTSGDASLAVAAIVMAALVYLSSWFIQS